MSLFEQTPYESLSVTQVCSAAHISRNAFYAHYPSLQGLHERMMAELAETARDSCRKSSSLLVSGEWSMDEAAAYGLRALVPHEQVLRTFLSSDNGILAKRLAEVAKEELGHALEEALGHEPDEARRMMLAYIGCGIVGFLVEWLAHADKSIDEVISSFTSVHGGALNALVDSLVEDGIVNPDEGGSNAT